MSEEEVVKAFNKELFILKDPKNALRKQKVVDITKAAMSALRYYKHVVLSVEKFLEKCNSKMKIPGLYIIDSIVRQGQKQFKEKDVFGPRFAINIVRTIEGILDSCPADERLKVVRVINLWKTHDVFATEVWSSLLKVCDKYGLELDVNKVEQKVKGSKADLSIYKKDTPKKTPRTPPPQNGNSQKSNGSSSPDAGLSLSKFQFLQMFDQIYPHMSDRLHKDCEFSKRIYQSFSKQLKDAVEKERSTYGQNISNILTKTFDYSDDEEEVDRKSKPPPEFPRERVESLAKGICESGELIREIQGERIESKRDYRDRDRDNTDSKSSKSSRRRRSRSRSPSRNDRDPRRKRHRDKSPDRKDKRRDRSRSADGDKEREKDRKKSGLPIHPKTDHLVLASRTIWFGRLPTNSNELSIKEALKVTGYEADKINVINGRACAYVTMPTRKAAYKVVDKYRKDIQVQGRSVKLDWASGQGIQKNDRINDYWENDKGYAQIPYSKLPKELSSILQGNWIDVDTLPSFLKGKYSATEHVKEPMEVSSSTDLNHSIASIPPPVPQSLPFPNLPPLPQQSQHQAIPPPALGQPLPAAFSPINLTQGYLQAGLQPNLLAAVLQQQQQQQSFEQLMSQLQQQQPTHSNILPPPSMDQVNELPPRPFHGGRGGMRGRQEGGFFRGSPDFRPRGRGGFRGRGGPFGPRNGGNFGPRPDISVSNANALPLGNLHGGPPPFQLPHLSQQLLGQLPTQDLSALIPGLLNQLPPEITVPTTPDVAVPATPEGMPNSSQDTLCESPMNTAATPPPYEES